MKKRNTKKNAHYLEKEHHQLIIKILNYLKDIYQKMEKYYLQELLRLVKKNRENYHYQLREQEI